MRHVPIEPLSLAPVGRINCRTGELVLITQAIAERGMRVQSLVFRK